MSRAAAWLCIAFALVACESDSKSSTSGPVDTTVPSAGAAISFSDLSATGVTVMWGPADDASSGSVGLLYTLVRAPEASQIDTIEEVAAITTGSGLIFRERRGITDWYVADLMPGMSYAFAVLVRDNSGNRALYAPATLSTLDASAPTPGSGLIFSDVTETTLSVSWGAASDDVTAADQLQYKVVRADTQAELDTLAEANAITSAPGLVQDFTANITTLPVTGLSSSMGYAFAVLVRDAQGNTALYSPATISTPDVTPPTLGDAITFSNVGARSVTVNWGLATDGVTALAGLRYKVVRADDAAAIDTLAEADAISSGTGLVVDYTAALPRIIVTGLTSATSYAFAVIVEDAVQNRALYAPATVMTLDESAPTVSGAISVSSVTATGLTLSWSAATDNVTPQAQLEYKVVKATSAAAIDTLDEVALITSGTDLVQDFSAGLLSKAVTGLASGTAFAFAVVVKDQQGNRAIYSPVTQSTLDDAAPIPGTALSFANITTTSLTVNWGKATDNVSAQAALQYKLVMAPSTASIDTLAEVDAISAAPGLVLDYTADVATRNVTGLTASTAYAFALVVRDAAGNKALYAPASVSTLDVSAPTPGTPISFTNTSGTQIGLQWGAASDDVTPSAALTYKVVIATNAAAIDTLAEVDAITAAPSLVLDYTPNATSTTASGLTSSTSYALAVVVRDAAGNRALYAPAVRSTLDGTAPVAGSAINFSNIAATTLTVDWGAATDDVTNASDLQYKLVKAPSTTDIDTLAEAAAITGADLVQDFTTNLTTVAVTGLTSSTNYAFAVVVRDSANNQALYAPDAIATLDVSAPTPGLALSFSAISTTGMTVSWGAASDDVSDEPDLTYKVVRAASSAAIDTLVEVDAITSGPSLVADFTANLTSSVVTGLSSSTIYAFAVVVRDEAGNEALYAPATQATLDVTGPTVGTAISFTNVASTSLTIHWGAASDDVSAAANLQYKVVKGSTTSAIDTLAEVAAITAGADLLQNYTANITTLPVAGLSSSTSYAFAVVVRDEAGNASLYAPATQATLDVTAPTPGTAISFTNVASTSVTVNWGAATDDISAAASLQYKLVRAALSTDIDTLAEANAISGAGLVQDFTANLTSQSATGLTGLTTYAFAVVVRDAAGNQALYTPNSVTTPDANPPTPGAAISFSGVSTSGITVNWGIATDDSTAQTSLQYRLVRATTAAAIDTTAEVAAISGADLLVDWTANVLTGAVTGLSAGDFHYYAVAVRDAAPNLALYAPQSRVAGRIFYTSTSTNSANLGGPSGADALCGSQRDARAATDVSPKALLAAGATRRACTTANCTSAAENVDWPLLANTTYYNMNGGTVGTTNTAGIFAFPLTSAMVPGSGDYTYGGFNNDWTSIGGDCAGFTSTASGAGSMYLGRPSQTSNGAIWYALTNCSNTVSTVPIRILCVEP